MSTDIKMHTKILISQYQQHIKVYYIFNMYCIKLVKINQIGASLVS